MLKYSALSLHSIFSDSRYAVNCMNKWVYKWASNGWTNARGDEVANPGSD
jgi:ribonuclease HI